MAEAQSSVRRFLLESDINTLSTKWQLVVILRDTATVAQALSSQELDVDADDPLWPMDQSAADILGFVDVRDILLNFLQEVDVRKLKDMKLLQRMRYLEDMGLEYSTRPLRDLQVMGFDGDFLHTSQARSSLLELIISGLLDPRRSGSSIGKKQAHVVHRIAVFDNQGRITHIISQTDIIRYIARNKDKLGPLANATMEELGLVNHQVESISPETPAFEAMAMLADKGLSSLAVVDANGKILGNFSVAELRTIMSEHFGSLALPVGEFLALENKIEYVGYNRTHEEGIVGSVGHKFVMDRVSRRRPRTPGEEVGQELVLCKPGQVLQQVIDQLVRHRIHRVYIVDDEEKPVGIVTLTDILRKLVDM